jgi:transposase
LSIVNTKENALTDTRNHFSPRATLAAIGLKIRMMVLLSPIKEMVKIAQKTIKHEPIEKLQDALITILAGAHGLSEINTRLRADPALQRTFGRDSCADQSVVQATLNACTSTNVAQMMQAMDTIFQRQSLAFRHDFQSAMLMIDIDLTGLPCGKKCESAVKGYQAEAGIRWGRQMGRIIAAPYEEVIIDRQAADGCLGKARLGGDKIGPNPTDRAKNGTKKSVLTDGAGGPLSLVIAAANVNDHKLLEETLDAIVVERPKPRRTKPQHLCLDKGYDNKASRKIVKEKMYKDHIRRIGEEKLDQQGEKKHPARRYVVERTLAWLSKCRSLLIRYEKKSENYLPQLQFACALLWYRRLVRAEPASP